MKAGAVKFALLDTSPNSFFAWDSVVPGLAIGCQATSGILHTAPDISHSLSGLIYLAVYVLKRYRDQPFTSSPPLPKPLPHSLSSEHFWGFQHLDTVSYGAREDMGLWSSLWILTMTLTCFTQASLAHCNFLEFWGEKSTIPVFFSLGHSTFLVSGFQICHFSVIGRPLIKCAKVIW